MITLILRDPDNEAFLFYQEHAKYHSLYDAATTALERYFDKHFPVFKEVSPKVFRLFFHAPNVGYGYYDVRLSVGDVTISRSCTSTPDLSADEVIPYQIGMGQSVTMSPEDFPEKIVVLLSIKEPGVNSLAEFVRKMDAKKQP